MRLCFDGGVGRVPLRFSFARRSERSDRTRPPFCFLWPETGDAGRTVPFGALACSASVRLRAGKFDCEAWLLLFFGANEDGEREALRAGLLPRLCGG